MSEQESSYFILFYSIILMIKYIVRQFIAYLFEITHFICSEIKKHNNLRRIFDSFYYGIMDFYYTLNFVS